MDLTALNEPLAKLVLKQSGENVSGLYTHGGVLHESKFETYEVTGHISNSYITLTTKPNSKDSIDSFTCLMYLFNKDYKLQMVGKGLYIISDKAEVGELQDILFEKQGS